MQVHELKCLPNYFDAVARGEKTFEVRRDDRGFQKGDRLHLLKWSEERGYSAGQRDASGTAIPLKMDITYVLTGGQFGIEPGYVILGLKPVDGGENV